MCRNLGIGNHHGWFLGLREFVVWWILGMGPRRECVVDAMAHYGECCAHVDYYQSHGPTSIHIAFAGSIVVLVGLIRNVPHTKWNLRGGECALLHGFRIVGPVIVILIGILGVGLGCCLTG